MWLKTFSKNALYAGLVTAGLAFLFSSCTPSEGEEEKDASANNTEEEWQRETDPATDVEFKKEGELFFLDSTGRDTLRMIDIEIADDTYQTTKGLMYRRHMPENSGMLFIFPEEETRNFWMKNTHISLDIIFADKEGEIVSIAKYAEPKSTDGIPSRGAALYVLEVNAGFTDIQRIDESHSFAFRRISQE